MPCGAGQPSLAPSLGARLTEPGGSSPLGRGPRGALPCRSLQARLGGCHGGPGQGWRPSGGPRKACAGSDEGTLFCLYREGRRPLLCLGGVRTGERNWVNVIT